LVRLYANALVNEKPFVPKIAQSQQQRKAIECFADIGERLVPTGGIKRTVVVRPNQVRKGLREIASASPHTQFSGPNVGNNLPVIAAL
jgi:hypothetical protein